MSIERQVIRGKRARHIASISSTKSIPVTS
jgi:hypothetical protein